MDNTKHLTRKPKLSMICLILCVSSSAWAESESGFKLIEDVVVSCGDEIKAEEVMVVDLEAVEFDDSGITEYINTKVGTHELATGDPLLIEKIFYDGSKRRQFMVSYSRHEAAARGCNLLIVLSMDIVNKRWEDPRAPIRYAKRWLTLGYALVFFGSR
jgi:hypothetical protein